jgi:PAS domain S-box-containing protein
MRATPGTPAQQGNLGRFILERRDEILAAWEQAARGYSAARELPAPALRDHVPEILERVGHAIGVEGDVLGALESLPGVHALDRLELGYDAEHAARELSLLREAILALWCEHVEDAVPGAQLRRLNDAIDESVVRSVARFARARERTLLALDRVSSAALGTGDVETFLPRLLEVVLETTAAADFVCVLLREAASDVLRVYASAGAGGDLGRDFAVRIGEGFAGTIAARRAPLLVHDASSDPLVLNPALRSGAVHALYGVPLVHGDDVIGVAKMASRSAFDFSEEDQQLFRAMAQRATSLIVQGQLVAALRRREAELNRIFEVTPDLLCVTTLGGELVRVNPAMERALGYAATELASSSVLDLVHPDDRERVRAALARIARGDATFQFEARLRTGDGRELWTSWNSAAALEAGLVVAAGRDVTDERARSELEGQLIAIVSHDLRSPLGAIQLTASSLLRRAQLDARTATAIARIEASAQRAIRIVHDLLDFTRARVGGGIPVNPTEVEIEPLLRTVVDEVRLAHPGREIHVEAAGAGRARWDPTRFAQVLTNLLVNAVKYSPAGTAVRVSARAEDGCVAVEVHNGGPPIAPEILPQLFQPYRRGDVTTGEPGSLGLGLYIARELVRAHGGRIEVRSSAQAGTTFSVWLPREAAASRRA